MLPAIDINDFETSMVSVETSNIFCKRPQYNAPIPQPKVKSKKPWVDNNDNESMNSETKDSKSKRFAGIRKSFDFVDQAYFDYKIKRNNILK